MGRFDRRDFLKTAALSGAGLAASPLWPAAALGETTGAPQTFALETYAQKSLNYFTRMVDPQGQPYFNVFWTDPVEAAHDWPDFGDVQSRQLQAAIMAREMTGLEAPTEKIWLDRILSLIDPATGLLVRPATSYSKPVADPGDAALTLYALVTACVDSGDPRLLSACRKMADGIATLARLTNPQRLLLPSGFLIKPLMACARHADYEPAARLAARLVKEIFVLRPIATPANTLPPGSHMHSTLRALVGAADYALYAGDRGLLDRVAALYSFVKSKGTRFGFLPERIDRTGDIIACETCALMDFIGLAATLAHHGHPEFWGDVERTMRNHLVESQVDDVSWLASNDARPDTDQFTWNDVGPRMVGGYAGWSSPIHILACRETLNAQWGGPELRNKTRAFQNCCGGSGTHAFYEAWKNAARFEDGVLTVNLHLDKLLPQAEVRCSQPYRGLTTIKVRQACRVRVRVPDFARPGDLRVESDMGATAVRVSGGYLELWERNPGETIRVTYPLPITIEETAIGNVGFKKYRYRVTWKGDTVVKMEPLGNDDPTGWSEYSMKRIPVYYGEEGPGRLYRRERMVEDRDPEPSPLHLDESKVDFWRLG